MSWCMMSTERPVNYRADPLGTWILKHPNGQYVGDTKKGFWTPHRMEALRFLTKIEADACAAYLRTSIISGIRCDSLVTEPLFQM